IAEIEALLKAQKKEGGGVDVGAAAQDASQDALYEPMTVVKVAGPRVLLVRPEGSSQEMLRLQVRTSALFMPGMRLEKCRRSHQHAGVAFYHGRYPRRKGHL
ncbi:MAG: hypothetical protein EBR82_35210, partial [Caulobacteraceae bacterium]|nr:hypothetical protein [Caulobacteraceae bacterium]